MASVLPQPGRQDPGSAERVTVDRQLVRLFLTIPHRSHGDRIPQGCEHDHLPSQPVPDRPQGLPVSPFICDTYGRKRTLYARPIVPSI
jgi:hypothetical protein